MSASEKLKALEGVELAHGETSYPFNRRDILEDALPQIVAVVGAAEKYAEVIDMPLMIKTLTALEEALS